MSLLSRRGAPAVGLFVLAPVIGECLLGNLTVPETALLLPLLAPMYGGGLPERASAPGLGRTGLTVTAVLFVAGTAFVGIGNHADERFMASPAQLVATCVLVVALVVVAFRLGRRPPPAGAAPSPWLVGAVALVTSVLFLQTELPPGWWKVLAAAALLIGISVLVHRWSRREGWGIGTASRSPRARCSPTPAALSPHGPSRPRRTAPTTS